jgi:hypothetical protein
LESLIVFGKFIFEVLALVKLERRIVANVLETHSAKETADWVKDHPEIEVVSRDRCGLYA